MSENKSWDIAPKASAGTVKNVPKAKAPPVARRPIDTMGTRVSTATRSIPTRREAVREPVRSNRVPLGRRRRMKRTRLLLLLSGCMGLLVVLAGVALWQPFLRVTVVTVEGPGADSIQHFVEKQLTGTQYGVIPNNSIFFIPENSIRAAVLSAFPDIEAVSIAPQGLTTLVLKTTGRATVLWWCGQAPPETGVSTCYQVDAKGFVFSEIPLEERTASSSTLILYGTLTKAPPGTTAPVGSTLASAEKLPALIQFIKALRGLGADIVSVSIRGDEADVYTRAGTRITYVLGREQAAVNLATSGLPSLNVNDGSLVYVDLRFDSKLFFKKK